ncbi:polycystic kidney disease protein 1-like 2 [Erpetoichthys calabaricus]|uniref:polycystic kidney disease protein 1-like 2 n=1 Tax=Erpetoichthys calabaricus TaxID=27687 RepID=UPI002234027F|nr:polycystic kidney disease protein 1-like 2 [Erpetoichthys calabaricus]
MMESFPYDISKRSLTSYINTDLDDLLNKMNAANITISQSLEMAERFLNSTELNTEDPTFDQIVNFLDSILNVSVKLQTQEVLSDWSTYNWTLKNIVLLTNGILQIALSPCSQINITSNQKQILTDQMIEIMNNVQLASSQALTPGHAPIVIDTSICSIFINSYNSTELMSKKLEISSNEMTVTLPSSKALQDVLNKYAYITVQMTSYNQSPFKNSGNVTITGTVGSLTLTSNGKTIRINDLSEPFEIFLPHSSSGSGDVMSVNTSGDPVINSFNISSLRDTIVVSITCSKNISMLLYLAKGYQPNSKNFSYMTTLSSNSDGDYRWLVTPKMLTLGTGEWFLSVAPVNYTNTTNMTISMSTFSAQCVFWNETAEEWSNEGCEVGPDTQLWQTHCLCNHLTFFGSSFFVLPNQVDLSKTAEYFSRIADNPVVVILLSVFFSLYLITVVWAWWKDRKATSKSKLTILSDNQPGAQYRYLVTIQTGHRHGAGTSAKIHICLVGTEMETEPHYLMDPEKPVFERGSVDMFLLTTPFSLGELQCLRLWHDDHGKNPKWYIGKVVVLDLETHQRWHFLCNTWIRSETGKGQVEKSFTPAQMTEVTSFSNIFVSKTTNGLRDEHIWISIVDPPHRSPFTRVQRVSCCMCLLLCTMAINIMFWNLPKDTQSPVIFHFSNSVVLTWQELMIGIESAFLMFPINILIITIFRSIQPRNPRSRQEESKKKMVQNSAYNAPTLKTLLQDTTDLVVTLGKSRKNDIAELQKELKTEQDFLIALDVIDGFVLQLQGNMDDPNSSDPHWIYCSRYLYNRMQHISTCLEELGPMSFCSDENYRYSHQRLTQMAQQVAKLVSSYCPQIPSAEVKPPKRPCCTCRLPWWFVFVGWALLLTISVVSTFFTLLYGFVYGKDLSIKWVLSMGLSLFQSIFILQPLKVVFLAIFFALIVKKVEEEEEVETLLLGATGTP